MRKQSLVLVTWHKALKVLLPTCKNTVMDPTTCTALPLNALILTTGGPRGIHSCWYSSFAWL